jgi:hypothetical protein
VKVFIDSVRQLVFAGLQGTLFHKGPFTPGHDTNAIAEVIETKVLKGVHRNNRAKNKRSYQVQVRAALALFMDI